MYLGRRVVGVVGAAAVAVLVTYKNIVRAPTQ